MLAAGLLRNYLQQIGLGTPKDAAQQIQVSIMRQSVEHLEYVLHEELTDQRQIRRILHAFIYGCTPSLADECLRKELIDTAAREIAARPRPPWPV